MSETVGSQGLDAETIKRLLDGSYGEATPPGWRKDSKLSTNQQKVYVHNETGKVVVSHRGTVGTAQDWFNNAVYGAFGDKGYELTGRYKKAKKTQRKAEKKYGAENITTIGHSQGGLLAQKVGGDSKEIITLNKATRPQDVFKQKRGKNQTDIRTQGDVVSMFKNPYETQGDQVTIKTEKFNPLAEHATDVLDRMKKNQVEDQAPAWSTSGRPPGTMISRVGRFVRKSFFGRGPRTLEELQGGSEHRVEEILDPTEDYLEDLEDEYLYNIENITTLPRTEDPDILITYGENDPLTDEQRAAEDILQGREEEEYTDLVEYQDNVNRNRDPLLPNVPRTSRMERQRDLLERRNFLRSVELDRLERFSVRRRINNPENFREASVMDYPLQFVEAEDEGRNYIRAEDRRFIRQQRRREEERRRERHANRQAILEGRRSPVIARPAEPNIDLPPLAGPVGTAENIMHYFTGETGPFANQYRSPAEIQAWIEWANNPNPNPGPNPLNY